jgi:hypothetical protein
MMRNSTIPLPVRVALSTAKAAITAMQCEVLWMLAKLGYEKEQQ